MTTKDEYRLHKQEGLDALCGYEGAIVSTTQDDTEVTCEACREVME